MGKPCPHLRVFFKIDDKNAFENNSVIKVAVADDHPLYLDSVSAIIDNHAAFRVIIKATDGKDLLDQLSKSINPDIVLLDLIMPRMNAIETIPVLKKKVPGAKIMVLSGYSNTIDIMLIHQLGADGFLSKNAGAPELLEALQKLLESGRYFPGYESLLMKKPVKHTVTGQIHKLSNNEIIFLEYACTGLAYKKIAGIMNLSRYTIDNYRNELFHKFGVHTRQALVLMALKYKLVDPALIIQEDE